MSDDDLTPAEMGRRAELIRELIFRLAEGWQR